MREYQKPTMTVEEFDARDVVVTSLVLGEEEAEVQEKINWSELK